MESTYTHCYFVFTKIFGHFLEKCMFSVFQVKVRSPVRPILVYKQYRDGEGKFCAAFQRHRSNSSVVRAEKEVARNRQNAVCNVLF